MRQFQQQVSTGGINARCTDALLTNGLQATTFRRQTVDTHHHHAFISMRTSQGIACALRHFIVVGKHTVDRSHLAQHTVHLRRCLLTQPAGITTVHDPQSGVMRNGIHESSMALDGRRRSVQAFDFNDIAFSFQARGNVIAHHAPDTIIVGTHISGVVSDIGFSVKHHHRYAFFTCSVDRRVDCADLIGRNNEQIHPFVDKSVDLSDLCIIVVAGRSDAQVYVTVIARPYTQLCVQFVTPCVLRALRNAHDIAPLPSATSTKQEQQKNNDPQGSQSNTMCFQDVTMFSVRQR